MGAYHLWNPAYVRAEPLTMEAFVTQGEALLPPAGGEALAAAAVAALGLEAGWDRCEVDEVRTHYFSSYRGVTGDWEDDWAPAWRLRLLLPAGPAPAIPAPPVWGYVDLDAAPRPPQGAAAWPCLLIADAADEPTMEVARRIAGRRHPAAALTDGRAFARYPQLRCDLGARPRSWFEAGAGEAEATLDELARAGASVRCSGLDEVRQRDR